MMRKPNPCSAWFSVDVPLNFRSFYWVVFIHLGFSNISLFLWKLYLQV